jgi:LacI family transcriptional regulator, galactose operon repressor
LVAVKIQDVADAARVSIATVSRALNGIGNVTEETRRKVVDAAARLGYIPHGGARSLSMRQTNCVGAVLPDLHGEFFSELIRGIDRVARSHAMHLLLSCSHSDVDELAAALRAMQGRVDGLLVMSPHVDAEVLSANIPRSTPVVLMNTRHDGERYASLTVDNYGGARAMIEHLVGGGHERIALITGPEANFDAAERLRGALDALSSLAPEQSPQILRGDFSEQSGYRAGRLLLSMPERPDAIFAANDMMALGCIFALNEGGAAVPGDIAIAGFDDIPIARCVSPPLTTVRVRIAELGELALERLLLGIAESGRDKVSSQILATEVIVRSSCGRRHVQSLAVG